MRFAYARTGGPLLNWSGSTPPYQSRAGETRSLGDFYPTTRNSGALRRYGVKHWDRPYNPVTGGQAMSYDRDRPLGDLDVPRPGSPEIVNGYESPAPGAAIIHLGGDCTFEEAHRQAHRQARGLSGYMPEGAVRGYGQTMLAADEPKPAPVVNAKLVRRAAILAAAYHGVRRNNGSVLWGLLWSVAAYVSPLHGVLVPAIGYAQGYGQPKAR